jgi:ABC-2 type transport system ATP-binding protein
MMAAALEGVTQRFGGRTALSRLTLNLEPGSAVGLLGPNGAGKTTALRLLLGFATPTEGTVRLRGIDPREPEARRGVGYLPERLAVPARATVKGFLRLHAELAGVPSSERDDRVRDIMALVGVADRSGDRLAGLSKGLRQRVGFAQAFLGAPTLLLFDEPTSGLDPIGIRDARGWIASARERGCTVLVSSHVLSEVERTCDRVAILNEGNLLADGPLDQILGDGETLEDAFVRLVEA